MTPTQPVAAPDYVMATAISVTSCSCGSIYLRLHGPDGNIFAVGSMSVATAAAFVENVTGQVERVTEGRACRCASEAVH